MTFETKIVPLSKQSKKLPKKRLEIRTMSNEDFMLKHGSGTSNKSSRIGYRVGDFVYSERLAYEFGHEFQSMPSSQVTFNDVLAYGDCSAITESGWYTERLFSMNIFDEDKYIAKYVICEERDGKRTEGIAVILRQTSAQWVRKGHVVFAIIAKYKKGKKKAKKKSKRNGYWEQAKNPS
jgi:hypothetical protein